MTQTTHRSAIVTGSTSGIGLAIARALAGQGYKLMVNGFGGKDEIALLMEELSLQSGSETIYSAADMSRPDEICAMVDDCIQRFDGVDVLVNNAGIQFTSPVEAFPRERWDAVIGVNLSAAFHSTKAALPSMRARNFGRIINIASVHGLVASVYKAAYVAAKHGIVGLTKVVALETAECNITCNAICPGWVHTPLVQKQIEDKAEARKVSIAQATVDLLGEKQPSKRFVRPESIGAMVHFLCHEHGDSMTGQIITMDGGWTAQ